MFEILVIFKIFLFGLELEPLSHKSDLIFTNRALAGCYWWYWNLETLWVGVILDDDIFYDFSIYTNGWYFLKHQHVFKEDWWKHTALSHTYFDIYRLT